MGIMAKSQPRDLKFMFTIFNDRPNVGDFLKTKMASDGVAPKRTFVDNDNVEKKKLFFFRSALRIFFVWPSKNGKKSEE